MNIFITGATGFVGRNLIEHLISDSNITKIYTFVRNKNGFPRHKKIIIIEGDLSNIQNQKIDSPISTVIHLAASWKFPSRAKLFEINARGTKNVIEFCKKNNIPSIIFTSTINVYLTHQGAYSASKLQAEALIKASGLNYIIFRPGLIYGPNDNGLSKVCKFISKHNFFPIFGNGKKAEQPIYISEVIKYISMSIFLKESNITVDIGGDEILTYNDIISSIAFVMKKKIYLIHIPIWMLLLISRFFELLKINFLFTSEQIHHINEDLCIKTTSQQKMFHVEKKSFKANLESYL